MSIAGSSGSEDRLDSPDGRNETREQRLDRNWAELLQELRVIQTGTQIIAGFLLAGVFQTRFSDLDTFQLVVYLALVVSSIATTVTGLAPVVLHRLLFRMRAKDEVVRYTDRFARAALAGVAVTVTGIGMLIFDFVLGRAWGIGVAVLIAAVIVILWVVIPRRVRRKDLER
jgi:hypothetical protein